LSQRSESIVSGELEHWRHLDWLRAAVALILTPLFPYSEPLPTRAMMAPSKRQEVV
jgi:hypothetical protein